MPVDWDVQAPPTQGPDESNIDWGGSQGGAQQPSIQWNGPSDVQWDKPKPKYKGTSPHATTHDIPPPTVGDKPYNVFGQSKYDADIVRSAMKWGVDPDLLRASHAIEDPSDDPKATSSAGAVGEMQFMKDAWKDYGHGRDITDPAANIDAAAEYYHVLMQKYGNRMDVAATAYNEGPGNYDKSGKVNEYGNDVMMNYDYLKRHPFADPKSNTVKGPPPTPKAQAAADVQAARALKPSQTPQQAYAAAQRAYIDRGLDHADAAQHAASDVLGKYWNMASAPVKQKLVQYLGSEPVDVTSNTVGAIFGLIGGIGGLGDAMLRDVSQGNLENTGIVGKQLFQALTHWAQAPDLFQDIENKYGFMSRADVAYWITRPGVADTLKKSGNDPSSDPYANSVKIIAGILADHDRNAINLMNDTDNGPWGQLNHVIGAEAIAIPALVAGWFNPGNHIIPAAVEGTKLGARGVRAGIKATAPKVAAKIDDVNHQIGMKVAEMAKAMPMGDRFMKAGAQARDGARKAGKSEEQQTAEAGLASAQHARDAYVHAANEGKANQLLGQPNVAGGMSAEEHTRLHRYMDRAWNPNRTAHVRGAHQDSIDVDPHMGVVTAFEGPVSRVVDLKTGQTRGVRYEDLDDHTLLYRPEPPIRGDDLDERGPLTHQNWQDMVFGEEPELFHDPEGTQPVAQGPRTNFGEAMERDDYASAIRAYNRISGRETFSLKEAQDFAERIKNEAENKGLDEADTRKLAQEAVMKKVLGAFLRDGKERGGTGNEYVRVQYPGEDRPNEFIYGQAQEPFKRDHEVVGDSPVSVDRRAFNYMQYQQSLYKRAVGLLPSLQRQLVKYWVGRGGTPWGRGMFAEELPASAGEHGGFTIKAPTGETAHRKFASIDEVEAIGRQPDPNFVFTEPTALGWKRMLDLIEMAKRAHANSMDVPYELLFNRAFANELKAPVSFGKWLTPKDARGSLFDTGIPEHEGEGADYELQGDAADIEHDPKLFQPAQTPEEQFAYMDHYLDNMAEKAVRAKNNFFYEANLVGGRPNETLKALISQEKAGLLKKIDDTFDQLYPEYDRKGGEHIGFPEDFAHKAIKHWTRDAILDVYHGGKLDGPALKPLNVADREETGLAQTVGYLDHLVRSAYLFSGMFYHPLYNLFQLSFRGIPGKLAFGRGGASLNPFELAQVFFNPGSIEGKWFDKLQQQGISAMDRGNFPDPKTNMRYQMGGATQAGGKPIVPIAKRASNIEETTFNVKRAPFELSGLQRLRSAAKAMKRTYKEQKWAPVNAMHPLFAAANGLSRYQQQLVFRTWEDAASASLMRKLVTQKGWTEEEAARGIRKMFSDFTNSSDIERKAGFSRALWFFSWLKTMAKYAVATGGHSRSYMVHSSMTGMQNALNQNATDPQTGTFATDQQLESARGSGSILYPIGPYLHQTHVLSPTLNDQVLAAAMETGVAQMMTGDPAGQKGVAEYAGGYESKVLNSLAPYIKQIMYYAPEELGVKLPGMRKMNASLMPENDQEFGAMFGQYSEMFDPSNWAPLVQSWTSKSKADMILSGVGIRSSRVINDTGTYVALQRLIEKYDKVVKNEPTLTGREEYLEEFNQEARPLIQALQQAQ